MRRNIHYKPSKSASILSGVIACAMGVFGLFTIPSIGAMIGFKAIWCLMAFGMGIYNFLLAAGVVKYNGGYEITDESDDGAKERKSDAEVRLEELQTLCVRSAESPRLFYLVSVNSAAHHDMMMHVPALFAELYDGYVFRFARSRFFIEPFDSAQEVLKIPLRLFRRFGSCIVGIVETYRKIAIREVRMQQLNKLTLRILRVQKLLRLARFSESLSPALYFGLRLLRHGV